MSYILCNMSLIYDVINVWMFACVFVCLSNPIGLCV